MTDLRHFRDLSPYRGGGKMEAENEREVAAANWIEYNANPTEKRVGDCVIRALSRTLDQDWERTFVELCLQAFMLCDLPNANNVWGEYLRSRGYRRGILTDDCPECYTVRDFCRDFPRGRYVLALHEHVVAVIDGDYYDTWDSGDKAPLYYWYKEDD